MLYNCFSDIQYIEYHLNVSDKHMAVNIVSCATIDHDCFMYKNS